jgi:hypothetical protein
MIMFFIIKYNFKPLHIHYLKILIQNGAKILKKVQYYKEIKELYGN